MNNNPDHKISTLLFPGFAVLIFTLIAALVSGEFAFLTGSDALWKISLRFLRLSLTLLLPLALLPFAISAIPLYFSRGAGRLYHLINVSGNQRGGLRIMFTRPVQGMAVALIFATKLIFLLQLYSGPQEDPASILTKSQFTLFKFIAATAIGMLASLILSSLWALDDLHVRSVNVKTGEIKRPGGAVGFFVPVFFGFFGMYQLFSSNPLDSALYYMVQMALVLYPPFLLFSIIHSWYVNKRRDGLLKRLRADSINPGCFSGDPPER